MARPKNKTDLLNLGQANFTKLYTIINQLSPSVQEQDFPPGTMNRNIRDVLAHLHHWHLMFLEWYEVGMSGEKPAMPAKGYSWKTTPALNKWIHEHYQSKTLTEVKSLLANSYDKLQQLINQHSDEELFEKKRYKWTGSTSLGAYLISATSSHYDWAWKLIKKQIK